MSAASCLMTDFMSFLLLPVSLVLILGIDDKEGHLSGGHTRNLEGIKISCLLFNFLEQHFLTPGLPERRVLKVFLWRWKMDKWWPFWPSQITPSQASFVLVVSHTPRNRKTGKILIWGWRENFSFLKHLSPPVLLTSILQRTWRPGAYKLFLLVWEPLFKNRHHWELQEVSEESICCVPGAHIMIIKESWCSQAFPHFRFQWPHGSSGTWQGIREHIVFIARRQKCIPKYQKLIYASFFSGLVTMTKCSWQKENWY